MSSATLAALVFALTFGGALIGFAARAALPETHLSNESKETVKLAIGLVGTMSALVLGLLVASAKQVYDAQGTEITALATNVVLTDRFLSHYGPETKDMRAAFRDMMQQFTDAVDPETRRGPAFTGAPTAAGEELYERVEALTPRDDRQRELRSEALHSLADIGRTRSLMFYQGIARPSRPLVFAIVFWLMITFFSWGLYAKPNLTVIAAIAMASLAVASALFLIREMYAPYEGIIHVSTAPLRAAITLMSK